MLTPILLRPSGGAVPLRDLGWVALSLIERSCALASECLIPKEVGPLSA